MGFYNDNILPHLINLACGSKSIRELRELIVPMAHGRVLDVGFGSGHNLKFYDTSKVDMVWGLEPSAGMRRKAGKRVEGLPFEFQWIELPGEEIPIDDDSADTVVLTFTLCSIPDWEKALREMHRVLKPGGKLLFCEHGEAPDESARKWQNRIEPYWKKVSGGCHLSRPIPKLIETAGFTIEDMETEYGDGPKFSSFHYRGMAK